MSSSTESLARHGHARGDLAAQKGSGSKSSKHPKSWSTKRKAWTAVIALLAIAVIVVAVVVPVVLTRKNRRPKSYQELYLPSGYNGAGTNGVIYPDRAKNMTGTYDQLVIFGSSYSDNAHPRAAQYRGSIAGEPYWQGRWSDGPIWVEYLTDMLGPNVTHLNYAYGGATTNNSIHLAGSPDTGSQMQMYRSEHPANNVSKPLIALFTTTNDITATFRNYLDSTNSIYQDLPGALEEINRSASSLLLQLDALIPNVTQRNVNVPDILLLPILPVELAPQSRGIAGPSEAALDVVRQISANYNSILMTGARYLAGRLQYRGRIMTFDVPAWYYRMMDHPGDYGLSNTRSGCTQVRACNNASTYLWWDHLHLPTHMQRTLARLAANVVLDEEIMP